MVGVSLPVRLVSGRDPMVCLHHPELATPVGIEVLRAADAVVGVTHVFAERYRVVLTISPAFATDVVVAEVLTAIGGVIGEAVEPATVEGADPSHPAAAGRG